MNETSHTPEISESSRQSVLTSLRARCSKSGVFCVLWLIFLFWLTLWLRSPAMDTAGFHNEDVAGITMNADLILNGQLPLVDNVEYKAPGTFYLTAGLWNVFGRSMETLQTAAKYWSVLAMLGIFWTGFILYGTRTGCIAAFLYVLVAPITDSIDANYGAWMIAPYIWATGITLWAARTGRLRYMILAGIVLALSGLLKRQAAVLFPIFALVPFMGRWVDWPEKWVGFSHPKKALGALFIGLGCGFAPIMIWYMSQGEIGTFVSSYFFSESGWKYVKGETEMWDRILRLGDGFLGFPEYVATPTLLATVSVFMTVQLRQRWTALGIFLACHIALSFVGAALGLRFFKGYYLQLLPGLVWLAAHPKGPISIWFHRDVWLGWRRVLKSTVLCMGGLAIVFPAALHDGMAVDEIRERRQKARDLTAQSIARVIRDNSTKNDRIWVWGRWAWPIYFHADRRPATDFPKTLSVFTSNLTNTWRRPTKNTGFIAESPWPVLMEQLEQEKPLFIVLSHNENYHKFKALREFLRREYRPVRMSARGFSVYGRKGHTVKVPPDLKRGAGRSKRSSRKKKNRRRRGSKPKRLPIKKTGKDSGKAPAIKTSSKTLTQGGPMDRTHLDPQKSPPPVKRQPPARVGTP